MIFYEVKIHYTRQTGEDTPNGVKETYLVEGLTAADVEERLLGEIQRYISGEWETKSCKQVQFFDLIPDEKGDIWYKARVEMITIEDSGKEKRKPVTIYVKAGNITEANQSLHHAISNQDCEVISLAKSPIIEVIRATK